MPSPARTEQEFDIVLPLMYTIASRTSGPADQARFAEIVTNDHEAVGYFQALLAALHLTGHVRHEP